MKFKKGDHITLIPESLKGYLTIGKIYKVLESYNDINYFSNKIDEYVTIFNDKDCKVTLYASRFIHAKKIKKII